MVRNLLFNACKYGDGSPNIITGDRPVLSVTSSVTSIPEAELKLIFDPVCRSPDAAVVEDYGIGFSISHSIPKRDRIQLDIQFLQNSTAFSLRFSRWKTCRSSL